MVMRCGDGSTVDGVVKEEHKVVRWRKHCGGDEHCGVLWRLLWWRDVVKCADSCGFDVLNCTSC